MAHIIVLAGGKGTRMKSDRPKVLHQVKGVPIINRLLKDVYKICPKPSIIVNHDGQQIKEATDNACNYIFQEKQLGTGHAVTCARDELIGQGHDTVCVLPGDHPLISADTLDNLTKLHKEKNATVTMVTAKVPDFKGDKNLFYHFGRIIRNGRGQIKRIVEFKDANPEEREVREVNLGYYCFDAEWLWENISLLDNKNAAEEYYLTDMVSIANDQGKNVEAYIVKDYMEGMGINTPEQLKIVEKYLENSENTDFPNF